MRTNISHVSCLTESKFTHHMELELSGATHFPKTRTPQATVWPLACWTFDGYSQWDCPCFDFNDVFCVGLGAFDQPRLWLAIWLASEL